ncbi:MAG TPA: hypothetical protein VMB50_02970 [Myxococcales bacterium]|nr:hypothetical protein [Myxococcales bacterium]
MTIMRYMHAAPKARLVLRGADHRARFVAAAAVLFAGCCFSGTPEGSSGTGSGGMSSSGATNGSGGSCAGVLHACTSTANCCGTLFAGTGRAW